MNAAELRAAYDSLTPEQQAAARSEALAAPMLGTKATLYLDGRDFALRVSFLGGEAEYLTHAMSNQDVACLKISRFIDGEECRKVLLQCRAAVRAALIAAVQRLTTPDTITHNGAVYRRDGADPVYARLYSAESTNGSYKMTFEVSPSEHRALCPETARAYYTISRVAK